MTDIRRFLVLLAAAPALAGPVEFGLAEVRQAMEAKGVRPGLIRFKTEVTAGDAPESWRIQPGRVTGGDLRGLMYGLLEAAEQIRMTGRLSPAKGSAATPIRGIRYFLHNEELEKSWYHSREYWLDYLRMLARNRFNRFNLVFAHQTEYLAPPYPFWVSLDEFPGVRVPGLSPAQRDLNLEMLRFISQTAADHGIDFTLGVWEHDVQRGMKPSVEGLTPENIGPYSHSALKKVLALCPAIRSVQMRTNSESGIPAERQVAFYRDWVYRALREAGRRVVLDLRGWVMQPEMLQAALGSGLPVRLSSKYWAEHIARPYQPAETWPNYSYIGFLEKPAGRARPYEFYWEVWGLGSHRLLLWGDPDFVRRAAPTFQLSGSSGFEIDPPLAQKGFGNRPGSWGVFTEKAKDRVFWRHEFERYWMFYLLWGRLSYDPSLPERVWMSELRRRFGAGAPDMLEAYSKASRILGEIVAAHMADPNMYVWPEINCGGLLDAYREVRPSDWRFVASIPEAVHGRLAGESSAKQTPLDTATLLHRLALETEQALGRAGKTVAPSPEWRSTESDFRVLALLARFHGRRQMAADHLAYFYETGDPASLDAARRETGAAVRIWEELVRRTDGVYPDSLAFGPDDYGHWKDKLPYVRHDLRVLEDRLKVFEAAGRFEHGFDFGGAVAAPRPLSYRNDPYVVRNTVEPRFKPVAADTLYSDETGYGWTAPAEREAHALPLTPYSEVRATKRDPAQLPANTLFGDWIRGRGAQTFRVRTGGGQLEAFLLKPDGGRVEVASSDRNGVLDIVFPDGDWEVSGLIVRRRDSPGEPRPRTWPQPLPRPTISHTPPKTAPPGRALPLSIRLWPPANVTSVRLHYRPLNHLAAFKTLEAGPGKPFRIPAEDISERWDLIYYFEILNRERTGWFHPDPADATPYFVVSVAR